MGEPIFVLSASRSGSTLLRLLLETHPEVAGLGETRLAESCEALLGTWGVVSMAVPGQISRPQILENVRYSVSQALDAVVASKGAKRWVDKSLPNVHSISTLAEIFPDAQFICIVRHPFDVVASGLEASPLGFGSFGYAEYVRESPANVVDAILTYWCDTVEKQIEATKSLGVRLQSVRYEDLVREPTKELHALFSFLNLSLPFPSADEVFRTPHGAGSGDFKILFTEEIDASSVGRGSSIPVGVVRVDLLERVNRAASALGYRPIGGDWNQLDNTSIPPCDHVQDVGRCIRILSRPELARSLDSGDPRQHIRLHLYDSNCTGYVVANGISFHPPAAFAGQRVVVSNCDTLCHIVDGSKNLGVAIREGSIRGQAGTAELANLIRTLRELQPR